MRSESENIPAETIPGVWSRMPHGEGTEKEVLISLILLSPVGGGPGRPSYYVSHQRRRQGAAHGAPYQYLAGARDPMLEARKRPHHSQTFHDIMIF